MGYNPFKFLLGILGLWDTSITNQYMMNQTCPTQLEIIGSGLSKTGTQSLKYGLEQLGYRVYNMESMMYYNHFEYLNNITLADTYEEEQLAIQTYHDAILETHATVVLDFPTNNFALNFHALSPEAKVIHTTRNPQKWTESIEHTFNSFVPLIGPPFSWFFDLETLGRDFFGSFCNHKIHRWKGIPYLFTIRDYHECRTLFVQHEQEITQHFHEVLVYNVKQGWDPLLHFLNQSNYSTLDEFPHANKRLDLDTIAIVIRVIAFGYPFFIGMILGVCVLIIT